MPNPSYSRLMTGILLTCGIFVSGAYLAAAVPTGIDPADNNDEPRKSIRDSPHEQPTAGPNAARASEQAVQPGIDKSAIADLKTLSVEITNVRNNLGKVVIMIFDNAESYASYDYESAVEYHELDAKKSNVSAVFPLLTKGPWAVVVFHDENGDQDFNMNDDIPLEGYGTSGAEGPYDTVSFSRASVMAGNVTVKIQYLQ